MLWSDHRQSQVLAGMAQDAATVDAVVISDDSTDEGKSEHQVSDSSSPLCAKQVDAVDLLSDDGDFTDQAIAQQPQSTVVVAGLQLMGSRSQWKPHHQHLKYFAEATERADLASIVVTIDHKQLTVEILQMLRKGEWLNDEILNAYLVLLQVRAIQKDSVTSYIHTRITRRCMCARS